jgi:DNA-binding LacI/PurR family transcriptional regulator
MQHVGVSKEIRDVLASIKPDKLIIVDREIRDFSHKAGRVVQDFRQDIFNALSDTLEKIQKYKKVILVYPSKALYPYPQDILIGFKSFCIRHKIDFEVLDEIYDGMEFQEKDLFIVIQESDLVELVKQTRDRHYKLGEEIGIISYNDTPLKDLLGISVISTDFHEMGKLAAEMLLSENKQHIKNQFRFIDRNSH